MSEFFNIQEIEQALREYIRLAKSGSGEHQEKLGIYYWTKADTENAKKYLEFAAEGGSVSAMVMLAELYHNPPIINVGIDFGSMSDDWDEEKSWYWTKKAAEHGDRFSMHKLAQLYIEDLQTQQLAVELYFKAAEKGNMDACNDIGALYDYGIGVEEDKEKAFYWYEKAAKYNDAVALFNVGQCYLYGKGVEADPLKALDYYAKSAEQGYGDACHEMGCYFDEGIYVERDPYEAYKWFRRGALSENTYSLYSLALCYEKGIGVEVDYEKAFMLYYALATKRKPYSDAFSKIGVFFAEGYGVEKNPGKAVLWFKKGANAGSVSSMRNLATCYREGIGVAKDLAYAAKLDREAEKIADERSEK